MWTTLEGNPLSEFVRGTIDPFFDVVFAFDTSVFENVRNADVILRQMAEDCGDDAGGDKMTTATTLWM